jgi:hypothetical protein
LFQDGLGAAAGLAGFLLPAGSAKDCGVLGQHWGQIGVLGSEGPFGNVDR